jgi:hypothetical protein
MKSAAGVTGWSRSSAVVTVDSARAACSELPAPHGTCGEIVAKRPRFRAPRESTSCGNRPVRRATFAPSALRWPRPSAPRESRSEEKRAEALDELESEGGPEGQPFGELYEQILNDLQSAGNAGEYYTPRAVTAFMADRIPYTDDDTPSSDFPRHAARPVHVEVRKGSLCSQYRNAVASSRRSRSP